VNAHKRSQGLAVFLLGVATLLILAVVAFIIGFVLRKGLPQVSLEFLFSKPRNMGKEGGIFPAIVGTLLLSLMAIAIALPLGIGTAVYLSEYTRETRLTKAIRFGTDCLAGIPSIIFGLFGYIFFVTTLRMGWSLIAGALTLAVMVLPTLIRTSEEAIRSVPQGWREVSLSLGATRWETVRKVVLPAALPGILTGIILSMGRAAGETAPIIFTAAVSVGRPLSPWQTFSEGTRALPWNIFNLAAENEAISEMRHVQYGMVLVLVLIVLALSLAAIVLRARISKKLRG
jgi:phosphate transport system permease protein